MPGAMRNGDATSGHQAWAPRKMKEGSSNVIINGKGAVRVGVDEFPLHCVKGSCHKLKMAKGSSNVNVNGASLARLGDKAACGESAVTGSANVIVGG